jgi:hypothetical protein
MNFRQSTLSVLFLVFLSGLLLRCKPMETTEVLPVIQNDSVTDNGQVKICWERITGQMKPEFFSVNDYALLFPSNADSGGLKVNDFLQQLRPAVIRIHNGRLMEVWTSAATRSINRDTIRKAFAFATGYGQSKIMLNIDKWPAWIAPISEPLPDEKISEFENLVRELVRFLKIDLGKTIHYYEVTNELEIIYENAGQLPRLWELYNRIAGIIRSEVPEAQIGGPAFRTARSTWFNGFLSSATAKPDFLSWHYYRSGNPASISDDEVANNKPTWAFDITRNAENTFPGTKTWLTEFNLQWTWNPVEARHGNVFGALFQYQILKLAQQYQFEGTMVWHLKGNAYGLIDDQDSIRTTGYFFLLGNKFLIGNKAETLQSEEANGLDFMAVTKDGHRNLLVCNLTENFKTLKNNHLLLGAKPGYPRFIYQLNTLRLSPIAIQAFEGEMSLPPYSMTFFSTKSR